MSQQAVDRYSEGISSVASTPSTARSGKKKGGVGNLKKNHISVPVVRNIMWGHVEN